MHKQIKMLSGLSLLVATMAMGCIAEPVGDFELPQNETHADNGSGWTTTIQECNDQCHDIYHTCWIEKHVARNSIYFSSNCEAWLTTCLKRCGERFPQASAPTSGISWVDTVGVSASGEALIKTASTTWGNARARSSESFSGNGSLEFVATETDTYRMIGLSAANSQQSQQSQQSYQIHTIDFAVHLMIDGYFEIHEGGNYTGASGRYEPGDRFTVQVFDGEVSYKQNDTVLSMSRMAGTSPLVVEAAFYTTGSSVLGVSLASQQ